MKKKLIILGILETAIPLISLSSLIKLLELQNNLGTNSVIPFIGLFFFIILLVISLTQIIIGLFSLEPKLGKSRTKVLVKIGLLLAVLAVPAMYYFTISSVFDIAIPALKQNPYYSQ